MKPTIILAAAGMMLIIASSAVFAVDLSRAFQESYAAEKAGWSRAAAWTGISASMQNTMILGKWVI